MLTSWKYREKARAAAMASARSMARIRATIAADVSRLSSPLALSCLSSSSRLA